MEDLFSLASAWEMRTYMPDVLLRDSDVMSMRHSLELRVPFIDRPLVEWLWRQPARFREDRRHPKSALVEATGDILPPGLVKRKKRGFTLPFPIWMRKDLRPFLEDTFSTASVGRSGLFSPDPVRSLWTDFASGGMNREWSRVWSLAVLIAFVNRGRKTP
jgi:asparagine synthase (glutamine-hydrolysing)